MIRTATRSDFDFIHRLYMHPAVNPFLLYEAMDASSFQPVFAALCDEGVLYVYEANGIPAGMFKFVQLKHRCDHIAYLGGLAIHPDAAGKGNGNALMAAIIGLGKAMNLVRIELSTAVHNHRAIALYEKNGFQKEGVLRKYTHLKSENRYVDEVMMAYLYAQ